VVKRPGQGGIALVAALLTLAAMATLALATTLLLQFDIRLASNRQSLALARAQAYTRLTLALLELEAAAQSGELPETAPATAGLLEYQRFEPRVATLRLVGEARTASHETGVRIELRPVGGGWNVHIVERR
jgi:type II secretory pathway component PulK